VLEGSDEIEGSSLRVGTWAMRLTGTPSNDSPWDVGVRHVKRERSSFPEVSGGPELATNRDVETGDGDELSINGRGSWTMSDKWQSEIQVSATRLRDDVRVPAVASGALDGQPAFSIDAEYRRAQILWLNKFTVSDDTQVVAGIDTVDETGSDQGDVDLQFAVLPNSYELDRSVVSAFAEIGTQWNPGVTTAMAVRWDQFGGDGRLSGKIGLTREFSPAGSRVWARIASGFKLPSFFALGNPLYGNPGLRPETVRSAEIGYTHVTDNRSQLSVSAFSSRYDNLVDFDFESFRNVNRGRVDIDGIEFRSGIEVSPTIRLHFDVTVLDIASESGTLRRRPKRTGGLGLQWTPASSWHVDISARYSGSRLITSIPTGDVEDDGFALLSASIRHTRERGDLWIAIDNALDTRYQDAPGFPSPGTRVRIGGALSF
jgi:outer membrane cobalamin receptor